MTLLSLSTSYPKVNFVFLSRLLCMSALFVSNGQWRQLEPATPRPNQLTTSWLCCWRPRDKHSVCLTEGLPAMVWEGILTFSDNPAGAQHQHLSIHRPYSQISSLFCIEKERKWDEGEKERGKMEKGDCGPPSRKVFFLIFCRTWRRIRHWTILRWMVRWCIRLTRLTLVCEVIIVHSLITGPWKLKSWSKSSLGLKSAAVKLLKQGSVILTSFVSLTSTGNFLRDHDVILAPLFSRHFNGPA